MLVARPLATWTCSTPGCHTRHTEGEAHCRICRRPRPTVEVAVCPTCGAEQTAAEAKAASARLSQQEADKEAVRSRERAQYESGSEDEGGQSDGQSGDEDALFTDGAAAELEQQAESSSVVQLADASLAAVPLPIFYQTHVTELRLPRCGLRALAAEVGNLSALAVLDVSGNRLRALPAEVGANLEALQELLVHDNRLRALPAPLPARLRRLVTRGNRLRRLPAALPAALTELDARGNLLRELPAALPASLALLDARDNRLRALPPPPTVGCQLARLLLGGNRLQRVPSEVGLLPLLAELDVSRNPLRAADALPDSLRRLSALQELAAPEHLAARVRDLRAQAECVARVSHASGAVDLSDRGLTELPLREAAERDGSPTALLAARNALRALPPELGRLRLLRTLDVSGNSLTELPPELGRLAELVVLRVEGNQLRRLPEETCALAALQQLSAFGNQLEALPAALGRLARLAELSVQSNALRELPASLGDLAQLSVVRARANFLEALPAALPPALVELDVRDNHLRALPEQLPPLLLELRAGGNFLEALPAQLPASLALLLVRDNCVAALPAALPAALQEIDVRGNQLRELPAAVGALEQLRRCDARDNPLERLPQSVFALLLRGVELRAPAACVERMRDLETQAAVAQLLADGTSIVDKRCAGLTAVPDVEASDTTRLVLSRNRLTHLPPRVTGTLGRLLHLDVSWNRLKSLPGEVRALSSLQTLLAQHNELETLPADFGTGMVALRVLNVDDNRLGALPPTVSQLQALVTLYVRGNPLQRQLPASLAQLQGLEELYVSPEQVDAVPGDVRRLSKLKVLLTVGEADHAIPADELKLLTKRMRALEDASTPRLVRIPEAAKAKGNEEEEFRPGVHVHTVAGGSGAVVAVSATRERVLVRLSDKSEAWFERAELQQQKKNKKKKAAAQGRPVTADVAHAVFASKLASEATEVDVSDAELVELPHFVATPAVTSTVVLRLRHNRLRAIPTQIGDVLVHLQVLDVSHNRLAALPETVGRLGELRRLLAFDNQLRVLPSLMGRLGALEELEVGRNHLQSLAGQLRTLTALTALGASENRLAALPAEVGCLRRLERLDVRGNALKRLPPELGRTRLRELLASRNHLESQPLAEGAPHALPAALAQLERLEVLDLGSNQLRSVPVTLLALLPRLRELVLSENPLARLAPQAALLFEHAAEHVLAHGCPLQSPPPAVLSQGREGAVGRHFRAAAARRALACQMTLTVVVLGGSAALVDADPFPGVDALHLDVWSLQQQASIGAHLHLLTPDAAFVVVVGGEDVEFERDVRPWLDLLRARVPGAVVQLVAPELPWDDEGLLDAQAQAAEEAAAAGLRWQPEALGSGSLRPMLAARLAELSHQFPNVGARLRLQRQRVLRWLQLVSSGDFTDLEDAWDSTSAAELQQQRLLWTPRGAAKVPVVALSDLREVLLARVDASASEGAMAVDDDDLLDGTVRFMAAMNWGVAVGDSLFLDLAYVDRLAAPLLGPTTATTTATQQDPQLHQQLLRFEAEALATEPVLEHLWDGVLVPGALGAVCSLLQARGLLRHPRFRGDPAVAPYLLPWHESPETRRVWERALDGCAARVAREIELSSACPPGLGELVLVGSQGLAQRHWMWRRGMVAHVGQTDGVWARLSIRGALVRVVVVGAPTELSAMLLALSQLARRVRSAMELFRGVAARETAVCPHCLAAGVPLPAAARFALPVAGRSVACGTATVSERLLQPPDEISTLVSLKRAGPLASAVRRWAVGEDTAEAAAAATAAHEEGRVLALTSGGAPAAFASEPVSVAPFSPVRLLDELRRHEIRWGTLYYDERGARDGLRVVPPAALCALVANRGGDMHRVVLNAPGYGRLARALAAVVREVLFWPGAEEDDDAQPPTAAQMARAARLGGFADCGMVALRGSPPPALPDGLLVVEPAGHAPAWDEAALAADAASREGLRLHVVPCDTERVLEEVAQRRRPYAAVLFCGAPVMLETQQMLAALAGHAAVVVNSGAEGDVEVAQEVAAVVDRVFRWSPAVDIVTALRGLGDGAHGYAAERVAPRPSLLSVFPGDAYLPAPCSADVVCIAAVHLAAIVDELERPRARHTTVLFSAQPALLATSALQAALCRHEPLQALFINAAADMGAAARAMTAAVPRVFMWDAAVAAGDAHQAVLDYVASGGVVPEGVRKVVG